MIPGTPVLGEIVGWELLLVLGIVALLFGSSQIPKFARSIGEASREFRKGVSEEPASGDPASEGPASEGPASEGPASEGPAPEGPKAGPVSEGPKAGPASDDPKTGGSDARGAGPTP